MSSWRNLKSKENLKFILIVVGLMLIAGIQVIYEKSESIKRGNFIEKNKCTLFGCDEEQSNINELKDFELPSVIPELCMKTKTYGEYSTDSFMCLKSKEDDAVVSGSIMETGMYESNCVGVTSDIAHLYPEATFIDIGANIGTHSLSALAHGCKVVAVEPFAKNLAYISKSAYLLGKGKNVRYLNNAVSNVREQLYGWSPKEKLHYVDQRSNEGGTAFFNKEDMDDLVGTNTVEVSVKSVLFQDILDYINPEVAFIKIDVEGKDCQVIQDYLLKQNKKVFIPYILMEWNLIYGNFDNECPDFFGLVEGFYNSGYSAHDIHYRGVISHERIKNNWDNVIWVHKDAKKIELKKGTIKFEIGGATF